ncbi:MAG: c-type cytochrome [Magnetococcales bacterium]|nr:c-type cytochrome [Magnetococcales bacterium]
MLHKKIRLLALAGGMMAGAMLTGAPAQAEPTAEMLANTCAGCHGTLGQSAGPASPAIAGFPKNFLKTVLTEFKSGERPATIMDRIAKGYSDTEIDLIAEFLSKQKWGVAKTASVTGTPINDELAKQGEEKVKDCVKCHEDDGKKQDEDTPRLGGQWLDYLLIRVSDYKTLENYPQPKKMKKQIERLSVQELEAVAHYFANQ